MEIRNILVLLLVMLLAMACHEKKKDVNIPVHVLHVNPTAAKDYINLSEIADAVQCIKLQIDTADVMGMVRNLQIKDKYIYAHDYSQKQIFVFDKTGKFVSKLSKRGNGPGEYLFLGPFFVDNDEEYIEIIDFGRNGKKMKYKNISFEFIEDVSFPLFSYNSCKRKDDVYYCSTQQIDNVVEGKNTNAELIVIDEQMNVKTLFDKKIETNHSYFSPNTESLVTNNKRELFASIMYDNTFYSLDKGDAIPLFAVDFGKYGMNNSIGKQTTDAQMKYIYGMKNLASFPVLNLNDDRIMSFSYYFKENSEQYLFQESDYRQYLVTKWNNKIYHTKTFKNDLTSFPDHVYISSYFNGCNHEVWHEDYLVDVILPSSYFKNSKTKETFVEGIGKITEFDDPVIVLMKLKK
jgi:hypothetical protein